MKTLRLPLLALGCIALASPSRALDFDFSGAFTKDNDVVSLFFTVGATSTVTVFSSSWDDGGFDPILAIWNSAGIQLAQQDDGGVEGSTTSNSVSYTHGVWDSFYEVTLGPGTYRATIAQYNNFSNSAIYADGFMHDGNPHFTNTLGFGSAPDFNGVGGTGVRTPNWAFHILNVESATQAPDAASSLGLLGIALLALGGIRRRFSRS